MLTISTILVVLIFYNISLIISTQNEIVNVSFEVMKLKFIEYANFFVFETVSLTLIYVKKSHGLLIISKEVS